jgi:hypothetical protein
MTQAIRAWNSTANGAETRPTSQRLIPKRGWRRRAPAKRLGLCYTQSVLMENRNGLMIDVRVGQASGRAECEQGLKMPQELRGPRRITVAGDKGYDTAAFVTSCRALNVTLHVAQNERRGFGCFSDFRTLAQYPACPTGGAFALAKLLWLDEPLGVGLLLLGCAAGAPFLPKFAELANGNLAFAAGAMVAADGHHGRLCAHYPAPPDPRHLR